MKKLYNHRVFLQFLCVILVLLLGKSIHDAKGYNALVAEVMRNSMSEGVESLQRNNAVLLSASMNGRFREEMTLDYTGLEIFMHCEDELGAVLGIEHAPFDWMALKFVEWGIHDLSRQDILSERDIQFVKDVRYVNEALIDSYYDIIEKEGVSFRIGYSDRNRVTDIYKAWVQQAKKIAVSDAYKRMYDFETDDEMLDTSHNADVYTLDQAQEKALDFIEKIVGIRPALNVREHVEAFEFEVQATSEFDENSYVVLVQKNKSALSAYLSLKLNEGQLGEKLIDETALKYIKSLVPENYVIYDRTLNYFDDELESITYELIYYSGQYYDTAQKIQLCIDTKGRLDDYSQTYNNQELIMPSIISVEDLISNIDSTNTDKASIESVVLVRGEENELVYWVYMLSNNALYTIEYDAITGKQNKVYSNSEVFYNHVTLESTNES